MKVQNEIAVGGFLMAAGSSQGEVALPASASAVPLRRDGRMQLREGRASRDRCTPARAAREWI